MKYVKIFLLHFQFVLHHRARSFIWFLIPAVETGLLLLFWLGALKTNNILGLSIPSVISYYLFIAVLSVFLVAHVEDDVAREGIREGKLTSYLTRPISFYWIKFIEEFPYRLLQGFYGVVILVILTLIFGKFYIFTNDILVIFLSIIIVILAYFLFFTYKMIIGIFAFWLIILSSGFFYLSRIFWKFALRSYTSASS